MSAAIGTRTARLMRAARRAARPRDLVGLPLAAAGLWSVFSLVFATVLRPAECVRADGLTGFVATHLAQMRAVAACPTGTLGYGPHTLAAVGACAAMLAALVVAHLMVTGIAMWVARLARGLGHALAALGRLPGDARVPRLLPRHEQPTWYTRPVFVVLQSCPVWRRGPPVLA